MGIVIPGKVDPTYSGDLRYAEPIPGTAYTIPESRAEPQTPPPSNPPPYQESPWRYFDPGNNELAPAQPTGVVGGGWSPSTPTQVIVNAESARSMADRQQMAIRQEQQKNMVLGFIPNPAARYDKPVAGFLENLPTRRAFAEEGRRGLEAIQPAKPAWMRRMDESPVAEGIMGGVNAYREDIQTRPTKFLMEVGIGYGVGRVAIAGSGWLTGLAEAGKISQRTATLTPKAIKYGLAGGYALVTGVNVALAPTPKEKGEVVGRSLSELTGLGLGAGLAYRTTPLRPGMVTEQVVRQKEDVPVLDVRETIDLSKATSPEQYGVPKNPRPVTRAERAMLVDQYHLSPVEVTLAKQNRLSTVDILNLRQRFEVPDVYDPEVFPKIESVRVEAPRPIKAVAPPRIRMIHGFVPDIFTTEINLAKQREETAVFPGTVVEVMSRQGINTRVLEDVGLDTGVRTDQMTRTNQIVREETLITNLVTQVTDTTNIFTNTSTGSYYRPPPTVETPRIPPVIIPPIPFFGGMGGAISPGMPRWEYAFTEDLIGGDMFSDVFDVMAGVKGFGKRKRRKR